MQAFISIFFSLATFFFVLGQCATEYCENKEKVNSQIANLRSELAIEQEKVKLLMQKLEVTTKPHTEKE